MGDRIAHGHCEQLCPEAVRGGGEVVGSFAAISDLPARDAAQMLAIPDSQQGRTVPILHEISQLNTCSKF